MLIVITRTVFFSHKQKLFPKSNVTKVGGNLQTQIMGSKDIQNVVNEIY